MSYMATHPGVDLDLDVIWIPIQDQFLNLEVTQKVMDGFCYSVFV